jgi:glycosyltransferase involved in cell wall biosynthesis
MRIVFVTSFLGIEYGGAEVSSRLLMNGLIEKGHDVHALTTRKVQENDRIISLKHAQQIPKRVLTIGNCAIDGFLSKEIRREIEHLNPDIIHVQDTYVLPASVLANRKTKVPITATIRNNMSDWVYDLVFSPPFSNLIKRRNSVICKYLGEMNAIITVSHYIKKEVASRGIDSEKIFPIYNTYQLLGGEEQELQQENTGSKIQLFAPGFLSKYKGFFVLIEAMERVRKTNKDIGLIIAGDGPERRNLEKKARESGLKEVVKFVGRVPSESMTNYYVNSDIVVFPSIHPEPFGRVPLEAMAFGKPVIASNIGAIPEIVENGKTGLLVSPKDSEELAKAIILLSGDNALRERIGKEGRRLARIRFDPEKILDQHLAVYREIARND